MDRRQRLLAGGDVRRLDLERLDGWASLSRRPLGIRLRSDLPSRTLAVLTGLWSRFVRMPFGGRSAPPLVRLFQNWALLNQVARRLAGCISVGVLDERKRRAHWIGRDPA